MLLITKIIGRPTMSKFDFARLREQVKNTGQELRETFKTTDQRMSANYQAAETRKKNPQLWEKQKKATQEKHKDPEYRKQFLKGNAKKYDNPKFWENYYKGIERREQDKSYHQRRIAASNAKIAIKISTPQGEFDSISDAARHYGMTSEGMRNRVNSDRYPDFKKIEK